MSAELQKSSNPFVALTLSQVYGAALGLVQSLLIARWLGDSNLGVIAIIIGLNTAAVNLVDIRLQDLTGKLFYTDYPASSTLAAHQASVICSSTLFSLALGLLIFPIALVASYFFYSSFTPTTVETQWLVLQSLASTMIYFTSSLVYLVRFSDRLELLARVNFVVPTLTVGVTLAILARDTSLNGYFTAVALSSTIGLVTYLSLSFIVWKSRLSTMSRSDVLYAMALFRRNIGFIFHTNLLGYTKLLHRAGDVLLVGYCFNDQITGTYRLARGLTDGLYLIYDSLNQVYLPKLLQMIALQQFQAFRTLAVKIFTRVLALSVLIILIQVVALPALLPVLFPTGFEGLYSLIILLTVPFVLICGIHLWAWPILVHHGQLSRYTLLAIVAAAVQYAVVGAGAALLPDRPEVAALGYVIFDLMTVAGLLWIAVTLFPELRRQRALNTCEPPRSKHHEDTNADRP